MTKDMWLILLKQNNLCILNKTWFRLYKCGDWYQCFGTSLGFRLVQIKYGYLVVFIALIQLLNGKCLCMHYVCTCIYLCVYTLCMYLCMYNVCTYMYIHVYKLHVYIYVLCTFVYMYVHVSCIIIIYVYYTCCTFLVYNYTCIFFQTF